jgi:hypothetical protein
LLNYTGTCIVKFKVKAVSDGAAERKVLDAIRAIYKDVRITGKEVDYLEWPEEKMIKIANNRCNNHLNHL